MRKRGRCSTRSHSASTRGFYEFTELVGEFKLALQDAGLAAGG
jgi:hypothetical protein